MGQSETKRFCMHCGNPIDDGDAFCMHCGAKAEPLGPTPEPVPEPDPEIPENPVCKACGAAITPENLFCMNCGAKLPGQSENSSSKRPVEELCSKNTAIAERTSKATTAFIKFKWPIMIAGAAVLLVVIIVVTYLLGHRGSNNPSANADISPAIPSISPNTGNGNSLPVDAEEGGVDADEPMGSNSGTTDLSSLYIGAWIAEGQSEGDEQNGWTAFYLNSVMGDSVTFVLEKIQSAPASRIASTYPITATLEDGRGTFPVSDSWGNSGTGEIIVKDGVIHVKVSITNPDPTSVWDVSMDTDFYPEIAPPSTGSISGSNTDDARNVWESMEAEYDFGVVKANNIYGASTTITLDEFAEYYNKYVCEALNIGGEGNVAGYTEYILIDPLNSEGNPNDNIGMVEYIFQRNDALGLDQALHIATDQETGYVVAAFLMLDRETFIHIDTISYWELDQITAEIDAISMALARGDRDLGGQVCDAMDNAVVQYTWENGVVLVNYTAAETSIARNGFYCMTRDYFEQYFEPYNNS